MALESAASTTAAVADAAVTVAATAVLESLCAAPASEEAAATLVAATAEEQDCARVVQTHAQTLLRGGSGPTTGPVLEALWTRAQAALARRAPHSVTRAVRALVTDVALLCAASTLLHPHRTGMSPARAIAVLDTALIVTGAPALTPARSSSLFSPGCALEHAAMQDEMTEPDWEPSSRQDQVLHLVTLLQQRVPPVPRPRCAEAAQPAPTPNRAPAPASGAGANCTSPSGARVRERGSLPDFFLPIDGAAWWTEPFIVRGHASLWPAAHRWGQPGYLDTVAGPARVVPVEFGADYTSADWAQMIVPLERFLTQWHAYQDHGRGCGKATDQAYGPQQQQQQEEIMYLAQHTLLAQIPALWGDIAVPDVVYAGPPPTTARCACAADALEVGLSGACSRCVYRAPVDEDGDPTVLVNAWLGPPGTKSPAHTDPYYNCFVQLVGRKRLWLAPPETNAAGALSPTVATGNTAHVDVFGPRELSPALATASSTATLGPGDLLFLPPRWWHALQSCEKSASLSLWF